MKCKIDYNNYKSPKHINNLVPPTFLTYYQINSKEEREERKLNLIPEMHIRDTYRQKSS